MKRIIPTAKHDSKSGVVRLYLNRLALGGFVDTAVADGLLIRLIASANALKGQVFNGTAVRNLATQTIAIGNQIYSQLMGYAQSTAFASDRAAVETLASGMNQQIAMLVPYKSAPDQMVTLPNFPRDLQNALNSIDSVNQGLKSLQNAAPWWETVWVTLKDPLTTLANWIQKLMDLIVLGAEAYGLWELVKDLAIPVGVAWFIFSSGRRR